MKKLIFSFAILLTINTSCDIAFNELTSEQKKSALIEEYKANRDKTSRFFGDLFLVTKETHPAWYATVENLCNKLEMNVPKKIYISNFDSKLFGVNAFATKIVNFSTIVIGYNLTKKLTFEEVESVIAHELGHVKHNHIHKIIGASIGIAAIATFINNRVNTGFEKTVQTGPITLSANLKLTGIVYGLTLLALQRHFEKQADLTACKVTKPSNLRSGLKKLHEYVKTKFSKLRFGAPMLGVPEYIKHKITSRYPKFIRNLISTHPVEEVRLAYLEDEEKRQLALNS
ncbi:hypothetical protein A3F66_00295 [candidate division TM6 bacterium RIFCSPHIGHO2_12_FULL_32_22]|nr:MAG: hypothetical protein A3F66_00295 [candidate division TM6 bacterium RIFCSPHIGHO2_12_FULL_32_22]